MMLVEDYTEIDYSRMYDELLSYQRISTSFKYANQKLFSTILLITKLDKVTYLGFQTPDQVILFENWDGSDNGIMTGIDFETGMNILEPYLREKKINKLINKTP